MKTLHVTAQDALTLVKDQLDSRCFEDVAESLAAKLLAQLTKEDWECEAKEYLEFFRTDEALEEGYTDEDLYLRAGDFVEEAKEFGIDLQLEDILPDGFDYSYYQEQD